MTNLKSLTSHIPDFAKDVKINFENLVNENNTVLTYKQVLGTALVCSYITDERTTSTALANETRLQFGRAFVDVIKSAAAIMTMNNTYYRFTHISSDEEYSKMPAGLRMKIIKEHGIEEIDFEIYCLAASIMNGCGLCIDAHANQLLKHGLTKTQIQMVAKIAAVVNAVARSIEIDEAITL